ncbi:hypothetical protein OE88DRAFT_786294 [Heliocybe sulcata]|uniref:Amino acid permease/ SLC12A domain-containing protein n=1 Tax=Heliocybe sulcata TaxID=5364 RepID=A0A5C3MV53_9AGAM|nr:hypothetical protein OE88DRAFT_786294 [Heliocybe sulcata]
MMGTSTLTVASRQAFAFSRDGALPFSRCLYRINRYTQTPVNCVWFVPFLAGVLGLLSFAGSEAVGAVFTLAAAAPYIAYCIPITALFAFANELRPGPFTLGRSSFPVSATAVSWMVFAIVMIPFSTNPGPSASSMNYTIAVLGAVLVGSLTYYYFPVYGGAHWFRGSVANIDRTAAMNPGLRRNQDVDVEEKIWAGVE